MFPSPFYSKHTCRLTVLEYHTRYNVCAKRPYVKDAGKLVSVAQKAECPLCGSQAISSTRHSNSHGTAKTARPSSS